MTSAILIALVGLMYFTVAIDQEIARLKSLRCSMVAKSAKKKADALCAEMAARKARK